MVILRFIIAFAAFLLMPEAACFAKSVIVTGKAPGYANSVLVMRAQRDPVSRASNDLASATVSADGSFRFVADVSEVTLVTLDLSYYEAYLFLEPGAKYEVSLPPFKLRPDAERFNPFYQAKQINLVIRSASSDLNHAIRRFDDDFGRLYYTSVASIVRRRDKRLADSVIARLDSAERAINCRNPFFRQHALYRKAEVFATPRMQYPRSVIREYYAGRPVAFNVPAYWRTLEILGSDLAESAAKAPIARKVKDIIDSDGTKDAKSASDALAADSLFSSNTVLREVLVLRTLRGGFYSGEIPDGRADTLLVSAARDFKTKRVRIMAANVYAGKNRLKAGLPAPDFSLTDNKDRTISLSSFRGRFLYLCFMHSENYECMKALPVLDNMAQLHRADLDVLCVFSDDDADALYAKLAKQSHVWRGISWITSQRILSDYEVRGLPTYFLIDPDGCVSIAQAPGPSENVGPAIAECIRRYKVIRRKGRVEVPRTIYDIANDGK